MLAVYISSLRTSEIESELSNIRRTIDASQACAEDISITKVGAEIDAIVVYLHQNLFSYINDKLMVPIYLIPK